MKKEVQQRVSWRMIINIAWRNKSIYNSYSISIMTCNYKNICARVLSNEDPILCIKWILKKKLIATKLTNLTFWKIWCSANSNTYSRLSVRQEITMKISRTTYATMNWWGQYTTFKICTDECWLCWVYTFNSIKACPSRLTNVKTGFSQCAKMLMILQLKTLAILYRIQDCFLNNFLVALVLLVEA